MMKKFTLTQIFAFVGAFSWCLTLWLRGTSAIQIALLRFILGILPNIAAAWVVVGIATLLWTDTWHRKASFLFSSLTCLAVLILALGSEIFHHYFLSSPFDPYDMVATFVALTLYLGCLFVSQKRLAKSPA